MSSIREQVVEAVKNRLSTISTISGLTVERIRARPVKPADMPRLVVMEGSQTRIDEEPGLKIFRASIPILGFVKAATDGALGTAANALYAATVAALEADKTLAMGEVTGSPAGPIITCTEGDCEFDADDEDGHAPAMAFALTWLVTYQTSDVDPSAIGI